MTATLILLDGTQLARLKEMDVAEWLGTEPDALVSVVALGEGGGILVPGQPARTLSDMRWPERLGAPTGREIADVLGLVHELKQSTDNAEQIFVFQLIDPHTHKDLLAELERVDGLDIIPITGMFDMMVRESFSGRWVKVAEGTRAFLVFLYPDGSLKEGSLNWDGLADMWDGEWSGTMLPDSQLTIRIGAYTAVLQPEGFNEMYGVETFEGRPSGRQVWLRLAEPQDDA